MKPKTQKQSEERNNLVIYLLFILSFALILTLFYINFSQPIETKEIDVKFEIGDSFGILISDELDYGRVLPGSISSKSVNITNEHNFPLKAKILISSDISDFVFGDSELVLNSGETKRVFFDLYAPYDSSFESYSGKIKFEFRKNCLFC